MPGTGLPAPTPPPREKKARGRQIRRAATHPEGVPGFPDEGWWGRLARPNRHAGTGDDPLRWQGLAAGKGDTDPEALACDGRLRGDPGGRRLRCVGGRPVSPGTTDAWAWVGEGLAREGQEARLRVGDNASGPLRARVRAWIKEPNRRARRDGGVRRVVGPLPSKGPWRNPIEPQGVPGKRALAEPERRLRAAVLERRAPDDYGRARHEPLPPTDPPKKPPAKRKKVA